jgi:hypothetical protein
MAGKVALGKIRIAHIRAVHLHAHSRALMQVKPRQSSRIQQAMVATEHEAAVPVIPLQSPR